MVADLLDRDTGTSVDPPLTLRRPTRVLRVFAARNRSGAWAYLDEVGWRRVSAPTPAGSRDLLSALCRARLAGTTITVELTGTSVVAATDEEAGPAVALRPEPRYSGLTRDRRRRPAGAVGRG